VEARDRFAQLAERVAAARDRTAFVELFDYFAPRINSYLQRLGMKQGLAEDLAQDVMLTLWRKAHLFDPAKSSLSTWLFRVARNRRIDVLRRDRSALIDPLDPIFQPSEAEAADVSMDSVRRDERVRIAMRDLPGEQLELIRFAFYEGLSHSEIAERTNLPLGTVCARLSALMVRLTSVKSL
jgi:RNA polymerase sigma factor (sigma-70 family)